MRLRASWIAVLFLTSGSLIHGSESHSYTAHINVDQIYVRSGPGDDFYPTSYLSRGEKVEVYNQNKQGWLAVRPPQGSFSWVPAAAVESTNQENVAKVVENELPSQIGSHLHNQRNAYQVKLKQGELVKILGVVHEDGESWYQIAPPAGEFRWIHKSEIGHPPLNHETHSPKVVTVESVPLDRPAGTVQYAEGLAQPSTESSDISASQLVSWTVRRGEKRTVRRHKARTIHSEPGSKRRWRRPKTYSKLKQNPHAPDLRVENTTKSEEHNSSTLSSKLAEIEIALSRLVVGPKSTWRLEPLRASAHYIAEHGETVEKRRQAHALLDQIVEFEEIRIRHEQLGQEQLKIESQVAITSPSVSANDHLETAAANGVTGANLTTSDPTYDGSGWLMPVITSRRNVPQYALTDDYGRILKFVTPSPGLNLRRYLRQQIGITGTQRTVPELYRPHLMAERIVVLDRQKR